MQDPLVQLAKAMWRLKARGYPVETMTFKQISFVNLLEREILNENMFIEAQNVLNGINLAFAKDSSAYEKLRYSLLGV